MKKLLALLLIIHIGVISRADDKMKLLLPELTDTYAMGYFKGSGSVGLDYNGNPITAELDMDFEQPQNGIYGSLRVYDASLTLLADYAMIKVNPVSSGPTCKRVVLAEVGGKKRQYTINIDFLKSTSRNYAILFFDKPEYFSSINGMLVFDSTLRITPREKTAAEIAQEERQQKMAKAQAARKQQEREEQDRHERATRIIGIIIGLGVIGFAIWMAPRAVRHRRLPHLLLFTALGLLSTFPPYLLLPLLPAYFVWYYNLYNEGLGRFYLDRQFIRISLWSGAIAGAIFIVLFGWAGAVFVIVWAVAGYLAHLLIFYPHSVRFRCHHCNCYGPNEIVSRELMEEHITRTLTRKQVFDHREERSDKIIDWYKERYNIRIESDQKLREFRRCEQCGEVFITFHFRTKVLSDRDI
ncbi:hypothetical protein [uncultured Alistipes sp.]|jgi:hypothetical protein|uniref:hypothetical protein n=1 Tax=uncultured Alistipes sp. TaxID=538949 RepID=UPI0025DC7ACE|nr:hypothetical protein [uncultured Alistipes sp.]